MEKNYVKRLSSVFLILCMFVSSYGTIAAQGLGLYKRAQINDMLSTYLKDVVDLDKVVDIDEECEKNEVNLELNDGSNTVYSFAEPVWYESSAGDMKFKDVNIKKQSNSVIKKMGYEYSNGDNDYRINFSKSHKKGIMVDCDDINFTIIPKTGYKGNDIVGNVSQIEKDNETIDDFSYTNMYGKGTKLIYTPQMNGIKEEITLDKYTGQNKFEFTVNTKNCYLEVVDGVVQFKSKETNEVVQSIALPFAYDSKSKGVDIGDQHYTSDCAYDVEKISEEKYKLTLTVSKEWLKSDKTVYPVTIDPVTSNISNIQDAPIYSNEQMLPTESNTSDYNYVGNVFRKGIARSLIKFAMPSAINSGATINSAQYWTRQISGNLNNKYVSIHMITSAWTEDVLWSNAPTYNSTQVSRKLVGGKNTHDGEWCVFAFDMKSAVAAWANGTTNYGFLMKYETEMTTLDKKNFGNMNERDSANRPYTVINYTSDTSVPTATSVTGNPTDWTSNSVNLTVNGATDDAGLSSTPFSFSTTQGVYNWQVSNVSPTYTTNQTIYVYLRDNTGNIALISTQNITKIDKTAPTITSVTGNPTSWTNQNVTLEVNGASDSGSGLNANPYSFSTTQGVYNWQASNTATFGSNGTVYIYVRDVVGNISLVSTQTINKKDSTAPTVTSITEDPTSWTNGSVTLTVNGATDTGGSGLSATPYSFSTTVGVYNWQASNAATFNFNQTVYVYVRDNVGNISLYNLQFNNIDKTAPTITSVTGNPTSWTNEDVTLAATASDGESGVNVTPYSFSTTQGQYNWQESNVATFSLNQTVYIYVRDAVGNISLCNTQVINKIDKTVPTITSVTGNPISWMNQDVTLSINGASDNESGLNNTPYSFSTVQGEYNWQASNMATFSSDGTIYIYVRDIAGNIALVSTQTIDKIDKTAPTITNVTGNVGEWTNGSVTLTVNGASDIGSGLNITPYSFSTVQGEYNWQASSVSPIYNLNQTVYVYVRDELGNISLCSTQNLNKIDSTTPTITDVTGNSTTWTNSDVTLSVNGSSDNGSGLSDTPYSFSNAQGEYNWQASNTAIFNSNQAVYIYVRDAVGNIALVSTQTIDKIDKTVSTITDVAVNTTSNNAIITVNGASDTDSGLSDTPYSFSTTQGVYIWQSSNSATFDLNQTVYIYVRDAAGNIALVSTQILNNSDNVAPTITDVIGNPTSWTNQDATLSINGASDSGSGLNDTAYSFSTTQGEYNWQASNTETFSSNQTIYVYVRDVAGNIALVSTQIITKIDKTAPAIANVTGNPTSWTNANVTLTVTASDNESGLNDTAYSFSTAEGEYNWQSSNTDTFSSNGTVYIYVRDAAGNISLVNVQTINKIDIELPTITDVSGNLSDYTTSGSVVLTVNSATDGQSGLSDKPYSFSSVQNSYIWQASNVSPVYTSNKTIYVYLRDAAGNISLVNTQDIKIDNTAPTITGVTRSSLPWTTGSVKLTVNGATDNQSGLNATPYSFSTTPGEYNWQASNESSTYSLNQLVYVYVRDALGNITLATVIYANVDNTAPTFSVAGNPTTWTNDDVTLVVNSATDGIGSGLSATPYSFSTTAGEYNWQSSSYATLSSNGTIYIYVRDVAGNISLVNTQTIDKIDKTYPTLTSMSSSTDEFGNITLTVNASDIGSGIAGYSFDNGVTWQTSNACIVGQSLSGVKVKIKDNIGNVGAYLASDSSLVDDSVPSSPIIYEDNNLVTLFNQGKEYTTNGSTAVTYDLTLQYKIGNGDWTNYTSPFEISRFQNATVYARAVDSTGNISYATQKTFVSTIGQYTENATDFSTDGYRNLSAFSFSRSYNSTTAQWFYSINSNVADSTYSYLDLNSNLQTATTDTIKVVTMPNGSKYSFIKQNNMLYKNTQTGWTLQLSANGCVLYADDLTYGFDSNGKLSYISDKYSDTMTFTRTSSSVTVNVGSGYSYVANIDSNGNITTITNSSGNKVYVTYAYDNGNLDTVTNAANVVTSSYDYTNNILTKSSEVTIGYTNGRVTSETLGNGQTTTYSYDDTNNKIDTYSVSSATDSILTSSITYDNRLNTVTELSQDSRTSYTYYPDGRVETCNTYNKTYDTSGNTIYKLQTTKTYDTNGNTVSDTENGTTTTYTNTYDSDGNLISVTSSSGSTQTFTYVDGKLVREKGTNGKYTYYVYDVYGNVIIQATLKSTYTGTAPDSYSYSNDIFDIIVYKYDSVYYNNVAAVYDVSDNTTTSYTRDTYGNLTSSSSTDSTGTTATTSYTYDQFNKQLSRNDGTSEISYAYDDAGRTIRATTNGETTRYIYDSQGRLTQQIDSDIYNASLDGLNNATPTNSYSDPNVGQRYVYASNGNLSSETDKIGKTTSYIYDAYGHLISKSFDIYTVNYTINGNISTVAIGSQILVTYTYDSDDNLITTAYANGQTIHYVYGIDSEGNETKGVYYNNETTPRYFYTYYYNGSYILDDNVNGTKLKYIPAESSSTESGDGYSVYYYDVNNGSATMTHIYLEVIGVNKKEGLTEIGEMLANKQYIIGYADETYLVNEDPVYLAKLKAAVGSDFNKMDGFALFEYNNSPPNTSLGVFYTEDTNGNITGIKVGLVNGHADNETFDITILQSISYQYTNNKVTTETHMLNDSVETLNYTYDSKGNITSVTRNGVATYYHYDSISQLVRVDDGEQNKTISYTYDGRGNILTKSEYAYTTVTDLTGLTPTSTISYTYDNSAWADELTSYNGNAISYDALGNRTSYNGWTYTWEGGRLLTGMTNTDGTTITYKYDVDGIRTSKTVNGVTTKYTTINGKITSQTDGTNSLYFYYDSNDELFGADINGTNYIYVKNIQGDIIAITDVSGTIVVRYTYDAWGNTTSITGSLASTIGQLNPMRYRGYYYDAETGYYYLQSRYYEPAMGRFINSDEPSVLALGYSYGNNMFSYCNNNPVNSKDESGALAQIVILGIGALFGLGVQYLCDVLFNCIDGKKNIFAPSSSKGTYLSAAIGGAVGATGIGRWGMLIYNSVSYTVDYLSNCIFNDKKAKLLEYSVNLMITAVVSLASGGGAKLKVNAEIIGTARVKLITAVSTKKIAMYTNQIIKSSKKLIVSAISSMVSGICSSAKSYYQKLIVKEVKKLIG